MSKIDIEVLSQLLQALRAHSYTAIEPDGFSKNRVGSTTVSFDATDHFVCLTTVIEGDLYSFYDDLVPHRDTENGTEVVADGSGFELLNSRIASDLRELELGPSFD